MPKSRPSAPRQSGGGSARNNSRPAGRTPRPSSGQSPAIKSSKPPVAGSPHGPIKPGKQEKGNGKGRSDSHVSAYSVGSPLNRQVGILQSTAARLVVLGLVIAVCVLMVLPVARNYFNQRSDLAGLSAELQEREQLNANLENQLNRWKDDDYVIAQARERFTFVFPGESPYRVMDSDDFVLPPQEETSPQIKPDVKEPWFNTMWSSIEQAGNIGTDESSTKQEPEQKTEPGTGDLEPSEPADEAKTD